MNPFYVGPIGGLVALPDVEGDVEVPLERIGGSAVSLMGRQWRDTLGFRRSWRWQWDTLLPEQVVAAEALAYGMVPGPIRLLDPHRANRLPEQVASGGSVNRSSRGFAVTAGGVQYRSLRLLNPDLATLTPGRLLRGAQEWIRPSAAEGVLYLPGSTIDGTWRLPVVPGERLRLSAWVAGQAGLQPRLGWVEFSRTGAGAAATSPAPVAVNSTTWQRTSVEFTPQASTVSITPRLVLPSGSIAGSLYVTALSLGPLDAEQRPGALAVVCDTDDPGGGWRIGGGSAEVVPEPDGGGYRRRPFRSTGLLLVESTPF